MAESGYDYDSPRSMRDWFQAADGDLEELLDEEIRVAVANLPCQADYDDSARAAIADHLDEFKSMLQTVEVDGDSHG